MADSWGPLPDPCSVVLLIRHAQAAVPDEKGRYISESPVGLSAEGYAQASRLAESLRGLHVDRLISSDMLRAVQTAEYIGRAVGVEIDQIPAFREVNCGSFDGVSVAQLTTGHPAYVSWVEAGFHQRFATQDRHFPADLSFPGGERVLDMASRALPAFLNVCATPPGHVTVMVSHAWVISVILCHVLGLGPESYFRFGMPNAGVAVVRVAADGRGMLDATSWQAGLDKLAGSSLPLLGAARTVT